MESVYISLPFQKDSNNEISFERVLGLLLSSIILLLFLFFNWNTCVILHNRLSFLLHVQYINGKVKTLCNVKRQVGENLFGNSFKAYRIMFLGILHSFYLYCSIQFYHRFLLKSYETSISTVTCPLLISSAIAYRITSTSAISVLCNLLLIYLFIIFCSLHWLVKNYSPVIEWAFFRTFLKVRHNLPKFLS